MREKAIKLETEDPNSIGKIVWLSCEGENPADVENIGEIDYYPFPGIPDYHFPYKNQPDYLSPVVFAHLKNPARKSDTWICNKYKLNEA